MRESLRLNLNLVGSGLQQREPVFAVGAGYHLLHQSRIGILDGYRGACYQQVVRIKDCTGQGCRRIVYLAENDWGYQQRRQQKKKKDEQLSAHGRASLPCARLWSLFVGGQQVETNIARRRADCSARADFNYAFLLSG